MALSDQRVDIGLGVTVIRRIVYDNRDLPDARIQTGYVVYEHANVAVWRPFDPSNPEWDAPWRQGVWRNVYALKMNRRLNSKFVAYETVEYSVGDVQVDLPSMALILSFDLQQHIASSSAG